LGRLSGTRRDRLGPFAERVATFGSSMGGQRTYRDVDNFDVYDGPEHEALVADRVDFLHRHLLA